MTEPKFKRGDFIRSNFAGGTIIDLWYANTNFWCGYEYKILDQFNKFYYIQERFVLTIPKQSGMNISSYY